MKENKVKCYC